MTRKIPPLPTATVPEFLENNTMNPVWRAFWVALLAALNDLNDPPPYLEFADDAAAAAGGIAINKRYRTGSFEKVRVT